MKRISMLVFLGGLLLGCATNKPAEPQKVVRTPPVAPKPPANSAHAQPIRQVAHLSQAEQPDTLLDQQGPTDVESLVQYALANNPEIKAACYRARALGARVPQAVSLPDPQLMTTVFLENIQTAAGPQEVALSLSQKIPWFGKRALRSQVAYHEAMAAHARVTEVELRVIEEVKRAYFDLYFLQSAIIEIGRLQPRLDDIIDIARTKYKTSAKGVGLQSVLQAEVEASKLKTTLIKLRQTEQQAQARLAAALHMPPGTQYKAVSRLDRTALAETADILVQLSESCQPRLDAIRREICRDRSAIALASKDYWPDVTLGFNWYEIGSTGISPVANGQDAYALGVGVNIPINRKRVDAAVREAQNNTAADRRRYLAERDRIGAEVQTLYAQFQEQHQTLAVLEREILPRAQRTLELMIESYRTGEQDFQQLIDNYRSLLEYRVDFHKRLAIREQTIASLQRAVGCNITAGMAEEIPVVAQPVPPQE